MFLYCPFSIIRFYGSCIRHLFSKKIPSVTPSIIVVSVMIKPIAKSDCVASLTLNLVLKYRPFAASYLKDSITPPEPPAHCNSSESLSAASFVITSKPPSPSAKASVASPPPASVVVITQSLAVYLSKSS